MKATAELQVVPVGSSSSLRKEISRALEVLAAHPDLRCETHAAGTDIEGELDDILKAVAEVHATLHQEGSVRLLSTLKLETRTDKAPTLEGKRL